MSSYTGRNSDAHLYVYVHKKNNSVKLIVTEIKSIKTSKASTVGNQTGSGGGYKR